MTLLALTLLACAYTEDLFAEDMATATCQLYTQCEYLGLFGFESQDACVTQVQGMYAPGAMECPDYDGKVAQECIDGVQAMTCDDLYAGTWPQACAERCGYAGDGTLGSDTGQ